MKRLPNHAKERHYKKAIKTNNIDNLVARHEATTCKINKMKETGEASAYTNGEATLSSTPDPSRVSKTDRGWWHRGGDTVSGFLETNKIKLSS